MCDLFLVASKRPVHSSRRRKGKPVERRGRNVIGSRKLSLMNSDQQANPSCDFMIYVASTGERAAQMIGFASTLTILIAQTLIYSGAGDLKLRRDCCATS